MLAIELKASSFCAREMRGTASIAITVTRRALRRSIRSGFCAGQMKLSSVVPSRSRSASCTPSCGFCSGARTFSTMSAPAHSARVSATISAPAFR
jgi:hypothetical protein